MDLSDLYSSKILDIAANAPRMPRLARPDASARRTSRVCGSTIEVDLALRDGVIAAYGQDVSACALGQTSAAIVAAHILGTTPAEFRALADSMRAMLKAGGPPPGGRWADLGFLEPVRAYPARHASTLLVFEAICAALETLGEGGR